MTTLLDLLRQDSIVPWCDCKGRAHGFTKRSDGVWVRPCCGRRSQQMWDKYGNSPVPPLDGSLSEPEGKAGPEMDDKKKVARTLAVTLLIAEDASVEDGLAEAVRWINERGTGVVEQYATFLPLSHEAAEANKKKAEERVRAAAQEMAAAKKAERLASVPEQATPRKKAAAKTAASK